jgi:hypothetical protein
MGGLPGGFPGVYLNEQRNMDPTTGVEMARLMGSVGNTGHDQKQRALVDPPPYRSFPKIADFLHQLDRDCDDPPRFFFQYISVISDESRLGFGRIHEVISAINDSNIAGSEWLKSHIESAHKCQDISAHNTMPFEPIHISSGAANLMYQEMKAAVSKIEFEWANRVH